MTLIESKKQKTVFDDADGSKVIGYLEKDSPGTVIAILGWAEQGGGGEVNHRNMECLRMCCPNL